MITLHADSDKNSRPPLGVQISLLEFARCTNRYGAVMGRVFLHFTISTERR